MPRHHIQQYILTRLLSSSGLRYRDMRPENTENDLYNYHLRYLVNEGLAQKDADLYTLTNAGKRLIEEITPLDPSGTIYDLFRVNILAGAIRCIDGKLEVLNQRRTCHPFYGSVGIIGGPVKKGESIIDAAKRKFSEETGLTANFKLLGVIRKLRYLDTGELFSDILFHLCFADSTHGELIDQNEFGSHFWSSIEESIEFERHSSQGSEHVCTVLEQLKTTPIHEIATFYREESNILRDY